MTRDDTFRTPVNFTSLNVFNPSMPDPSQFVVRSDELRFQLSILASVSWAATTLVRLSVIEFGYWGIQNLTR